jgi:hypothetical protein
MVSKPSENPLCRRQIWRGQAYESLYPLHPFGFSKKGGLRLCNNEGITGRISRLRLIRPFFSY